MSFFQCRTGGAAHDRRLFGRWFPRVPVVWLALMAVVIAPMVIGSPHVMAQSDPPEGEPDDAAFFPADEAPLTLVSLTDDDIRNFLKARPKILEVVYGAVENDDGAVAAPVLADPEADAAFERIAKEAGFASFRAMMSVETTIGMYFTALNPETGRFNDPREQLVAQIAAVRSDKELDEEARNELVEIYQEMLEHQPPLDNADNVRLVKKHYNDILATLQQ